MSDSARFALHRPEFLPALIRGEEKIIALMRGSAESMPAGHRLIEAETDHPFVYRLVEGWASRTRTLADGRNQFILVFLPGDLFAVKSMFVTRHTDAVVANSAIVAERIDYRVLHEAYVRDGDVASRCIWQVMEEERRLHSWVTSLGQGSAEERLALLLLDFRGRLILSKSIASNASEYRMPLTQGELADHLGITAVHVNRVLRGFRESGIVKIRDGWVSIVDLTRLTACASALLDVHEKSSPVYSAAPQAGAAAMSCRDGEATG